jgi:hypothetical protein
MPIPAHNDRVRHCIACWIRVCLLVACCGAAVASVPRTPGVSKEYQVKAAFLYNFAKFVDWPADRFSHDTAPIRIAVIGQNPFGDELDHALRGRKISGRDVLVDYLAAADRPAFEASSYHVIYVAAGEERSLEKFAGGTGGARALTVGESARFAAEGGIVKFSTIDDKVRFEINADAADVAGLKISAQLLKLATTVRRRGDGTRP